VALGIDARTGRKEDPTRLLVLLLQCLKQMPYAINVHRTVGCIRATMRGGCVEDDVDPTR
jgi:hypothetical protein